jgi:membrane protease YdiL (CAAX protease family)
VYGVELGLVVLLIPAWVLSGSRKWLRLPTAALAIALAVVTGSWRLAGFRAWPLQVLAGVLAGELAFAASLLVLASRHVLAGFVRGSLAMAAAMLRRPLSVAYYVGLASYEEFLVRVTLQGAVLGGGPLAIGTTSVIFVLVHWMGRDEIVIAEVLEMFAFSCLLGYLFQLTGSFPLIVVVHAVRNLNISYLRGAASDRRRETDQGVHGKTTRAGRLVRPAPEDQGAR